ncbi:MAG: hypothetical protein WBY94_11840 [Polyangiaceae bacterium]
MGPIVAIDEVCSTRRDNALGLHEEDYLRMVLKKTCWYKELDGDIWEGKRTLMMIQLFQRATPSSSGSRQSLRAPGPSEPGTTCDGYASAWTYMAASSTPMAQPTPWRGRPATSTKLLSTDCKTHATSGSYGS